MLTKPAFKRESGILADILTKLCGKPRISRKGISHRVYSREVDGRQKSFPVPFHSGEVSCVLLFKAIKELGIDVEEFVDARFWFLPARHAAKINAFDAIRYKINSRHHTFDVTYEYTYTYTCMKTATFTSTISPDLIKWVDKRARFEKRTRRAVLEEALTRYRKELAGQELRQGFIRAAQDADMLELAEWGMGDYAEFAGK